MSWVRIRSWHLTDVETTFGSVSTLIVNTLCGRTAVGERRRDPPGNEPTCNTCYDVRESRNRKVVP